MTVINEEYPAGRNPKLPHDAKPKASGRPIEPVTYKNMVEQAVQAELHMQALQEAEEQARVECTTASPAQPVEPLQTSGEPTVQSLVSALNGGPEAFGEFLRSVNMHGVSSLEKELQAERERKLLAVAEEEHKLRQEFQNEKDAARLDRMATGLSPEEKALRLKQKQARYAQAYGAGPAILHTLQEKESLTGRLSSTEPNRLNLVTPTWTVSPRDRIAKIFAEGGELFYRKNTEYGNSIELTGLVGAIAAMTGDVGAARKLVFESLGSGVDKTWNDKVRNKLIDAMVQAAIAIKMLDDGNLTGK